MTSFNKLELIDTPFVVPMPFTRKYKLVSDMCVAWTRHGEEGRQHVVIPKGFLTDGASIPAMCWQLVGTPYAPEFMAAAIVHDWMCEQDWDVEEMSLIFYEALKLGGVDRVKALMMYKAVLVYKHIT